MKSRIGSMSRSDGYIHFAKDVVFRGLETPHLFHVVRDELYELEDDGVRFIGEVDGGVKSVDVSSPEILEFAESEGLIVYSDEPPKAPLKRGASPAPSLRYLELMITLRCNLRCDHCYLGEPRAVDMPAEILHKTLDEFDEMQGLRLLISGGEPLMYPHLDELARAIAGRGFRSVLLTNGMALDRERLVSLGVHEVQVSLDGLRAGHDALRGEGSFDRAVFAARLSAEAGLDLSVATMVHADNVDEMDGLEDLVHELGAREWSLDVPVEAGRWSGRLTRAALLDRAAAAMARGFGGSYHGSSEGFACGVHLASVLPSGEVIPCGFYPEMVLGRVGDGLLDAWTSKRPKPIDEVEVCGGCPVADDCSGGCRYRAGGDGPDPVMCAAHQWPMGKDGKN